ncbi:hypothetical protein K438DRAFT_1758788 [Mycena galopus ATCC 62051]|nr:hypothetical protein K438DRAFT_1758788 [Mycena galopus ATCC 62051]
MIYYVRQQEYIQRNPNKRIRVYGLQDEVAINGFLNGFPVISNILFGLGNGTTTKTSEYGNQRKKSHHAPDNLPPERMVPPIRKGDRTFYGHGTAPSLGPRLPVMSEGLKFRPKCPRLGNVKAGKVAVLGSSRSILGAELPIVTKWFERLTVQGHLLDALIMARQAGANPRSKTENQWILHNKPHPPALLKLTFTALKFNSNDAKAR